MSIRKNTTSVMLSLRIYTKSLLVCNSIVIFYTFIIILEKQEYISSLISLICYFVGFIVVLAQRKFLKELESLPTLKWERSIGTGGLIIAGLLPIPFRIYQAQMYFIMGWAFLYINTILLIKYRKAKKEVNSSIEQR